MDVEIKPASDFNVEKLSQFASAAFIDAYSGKMNPADIRDYISKSFNTEVIGNQIRSPDTRFHIAVQNNQISGYTKLRWDRFRPELADFRAIELERIYISSEHYRKGLGSLLLKNACQESASLNFNMLWLAVWQKNERALAFYKKAGFEIFGVQEFTVGTIINNDFVLKLNL